MARSWSKRNSRIKYHTTTKSCVLLCDFTIRKASQVFGLSTPLPCNLLSFFQPGFLLLLNLLFSMVSQQNSKFLLAFRRHKLAFLPNLGQYPVFHILLSKIVGLPMDWKSGYLLTCKKSSKVILPWLLFFSAHLATDNDAVERLSRSKLLSFGRWGEAGGFLTVHNIY